MMDNYNDFCDIIERYELSGEQVLDIITDWHGTQIISDDFMENLKDCEGYS